MFQERDFLQRTGHEIVDFSMQDARNLESPYATYFVQAQDYRKGRSGKIGTALSLIHSAEATRSIARLIDGTRPDIVHCHNIYHQLTPSIIGTAKSKGVPVVLTLHDSKPVCPSYLCLRESPVPHALTVQVIERCEAALRRWFTWQECIALS